MDTIWLLYLANESLWVSQQTKADLVLVPAKTVSGNRWKCQETGKIQVVETQCNWQGLMSYLAMLLDEMLKRPGNATFSSSSRLSDGPENLKNTTLKKYLVVTKKHLIKRLLTHLTQGKCIPSTFHILQFTPLHILHYHLYLNSNIKGCIDKKLTYNAPSSAKQTSMLLSKYKSCIRNSWH